MMLSVRRLVVIWDAVPNMSFPPYTEFIDLGVQKFQVQLRNDTDRNFDGDVVVHRVYGDTCRDTDWNVNYYTIPSIVSEFS
jgi:hypothetical protein